MVAARRQSQLEREIPPEVLRFPLPVLTVLPTRGAALTRLVCALVVAALALTVAACGSDDDGDSRPSSKQRDQQFEKAYLTGMVHHHETAIEMAQIARRRGQDAFITKLAADIVSAQEREIAQMKSIHRRLFGSELKPDPRAHDGLGLTAAQAGMTHDAHTNEKLAEADPFARVFLDEMVPHHRGAIAMSNVVLEETTDPALKTLANGIIRTQRREIDEMNEFRTRAYGGAVPDSATHRESSKTSTDMEHESGH